MQKTLAVEMLDEMEAAKDVHCGVCGRDTLRVLSSNELWCGNCGTIAVVSRTNSGQPFVTWNRRHQAPF